MASAFRLRPVGEACRAKLPDRRATLPGPGLLPRSRLHGKLALDTRNVGPYGGSPKNSARLGYTDYSLDYHNRMMTLSVELEQEDDGRWIAEVAELPGVLAYGDSQEDPREKAHALALRVFADRLEHGEAGPDLLGISFKAA